MQRRNYRRSSGVILDVCRAHGTFLDPDELEQIAGFILSGGQTSQTILEEHEKTSREAETARAFAIARTRPAEEGFFRAGGAGGADAGDLMDLGGSLLRLLSRILS